MIFSYLLNMQSHPSWVCGLKLRNLTLILPACKSHPSWVCGLKHRPRQSIAVVSLSHPSWVCGLKQSRKNDSGWLRSVTPFVGVWIETPSKLKTKPGSERHTLRGCVD